MQIAFRHAHVLHAPDDAIKLHSAMKIFHARSRLIPCGFAGVPQTGILGGFGQLDDADLAQAGLALDAVPSMHRDRSALRGYTEREFYDVGFIRTRRKHGSFNGHGCRSLVWLSTATPRISRGSRGVETSQ
jgi:hypothetical protein